MAFLSKKILWELGVLVEKNLESVPSGDRAGLGAVREDWWRLLPPILVNFVLELDKKESNSISISDIFSCKKTLSQFLLTFFCAENCNITWFVFLKINDVIMI